MTSKERARYLESGKGDPPGAERLDLIREVLADPMTWSTVTSGVSEGVAAGIGTVSVEQPRPLRKLRWLVPAGVAAVVALLWGFGMFQEDSPPPPAATAVMAGTDLVPQASGVASVRNASSGWAIRLEVEGLPPAPEGSFYQGWAWNEAGEGVSIGTFHLRGGNYPVTLWSGVDMVEYPWIWVTLQDEGEGAEASEKVVMRGRISADG